MYQPGTIRNRFPGPGESPSAGSVRTISLTRILPLPSPEENPSVYLFLRITNEYSPPVRWDRREVKPMSETQSSDAMKNLVKFLICLAILGVILALVAWYLTGNPGMIHAPLNADVNPQVT